MAFYDTVRLEKGMYNTPGKSFTQVLEELEEAVNETRACRTLEPETVISALQAVGERLDRGELEWDEVV